MQNFYLHSRLLGARAPDPNARVAEPAACRARGLDSVSVSMCARMRCRSQPASPPAGCLCLPCQPAISSKFIKRA